MAKSIVVLGDSISAAFGTDISQGWVALLQQRLNDSKRDFTIHNASISGETSAGGLARVDELLKKYQPDILIVELGGNDGLRGLSPSIMKSNLNEIINRAKKIHAKVLLLGIKIPPNYGQRYNEWFYSVYIELGNEQHIPSIPFLLEDIALVPNMMQADGVHPSVQAQPLIANKVWQALLPLMK